MGGNAVGQCQKAFEPREAIVGEVNDVRPAIAVGDDPAKSESDDIEQTMFGAVANPRVLEGRKVFLNRAHARESSHAILRKTGEIRGNRMAVHLSQARAK